MQCISQLPHEIQVEILSRLSVHDLPRCKFVSKAWRESWCRLVHDPIFVKLQRSRTNPNDDTNSIVICQTHNGVSNLYYVNHDGKNLDSSLKARDVRIDLDLPRMKFGIVGSSNGLICLVSFPMYNFYVCNPLTDKTLVVPRSSTRDAIVQEYKMGFENCGFAFDQSTNSYKIVYIFSRYNFDRLIEHMSEVLIYTSGSSLWRRISITTPFVFYPMFGTKLNSMVFLDGAMHELGLLDNLQLMRVVSFDLTNESFNVFKSIPKILCKYGTTMGILGGCLSLCSIEKMYNASYTVKIWIMKSYGAEQEWSLQYSFECGEYWDKPIYGSVKVVRRMGNGSIMLHCGKYQIYYDYEKKVTTTKIVIEGIHPGEDKTHVVSHVANFASPIRF